MHDDGSNFLLHICLDNPKRFRGCNWENVLVSDEAEANKATVARFWETLAARDWDRLKTFFTEDARYTDIGSPGPEAHGPENIIKRLYALNLIEGYEHLPGTNVLAEGDLVMTEHTERWIFEPGKVVDHGFVSVTQFRDGKICRWHDYSNLANIVDNAPQWWVERMIAETPCFT